MNRVFSIACILALPMAAWTQGLKLDQLDRLGEKARETVNVTLDGSLLQLASRFLDDDDKDSAEIKKLVAGLKGIHIRSFEFKRAGEYLDSDVEAIRAQLRDPDWKRIVQVHNKTEGDSDVYLKMSGSRILGLALISAEPKQLTVVSIDGSIDVEGLRKLGGNFGIPKSLGRKTEERSK